MAAPIGVSGLGKHEFKCEATAGLAKSRAVRAEAEGGQTKGNEPSSIREEELAGEEVPALPCANPLGVQLIGELSIR